MPASAAYLTKYLNASSSSRSHNDYEDSSRPKKRRKKDKTSASNSGGLLIADEDEELSLRNKSTARGDEDEDSPLIYNDGKSRSAEFRKKKESGWQTIGTAGMEKDDEEEADRIIAAAAAEKDRRKRDEDDEDAPAVVEEKQDAGPRMESGVKAGLQTAEDTAALLAQQEIDEERERNRLRKQRKKAQKDGETEAAEETIYRDATGRRIDLSMRRAEARAAELEKLREEKAERENAMGDVQRQQKEQAKQDLEDAKFLSLGRSADDEEMNARLREVVRWDDPMAGYLAEKEATEVAEKGGWEVGVRTKGVEGKRGKREYLGHAPPNRYGIKPGWRWDGVDRGNGFEKEWFQARGRKTRNENLEYQWQMDE